MSLRQSTHAWDITYTYIHTYTYIYIPARGRFKGFDWGTTTRLVVILQRLVVMPQ